MKHFKDKAERKKALARLPEWAQFEIERLEGNLAAAHEREDRLGLGVSGSRVVMPVFRDGGYVNYGLGDDAVTRFLVGARESSDYIDVQFSRHYKDRLRVMAGSGRLVIFPDCSNVVEISAGAFHE